MLKKFLESKIKPILFSIFSIILFFYFFRKFTNIKLDISIYHCIIMVESCINVIIFFALLHVYKRSTRDDLTSVKKKIELESEMKKNIKVKKYFSLFILDLNRFKQINDTYGHEAGNIALQFFTEKMQEALPKDATLYRIGGDEFAVLANGIFNEVEKLEIIARMNAIRDEKLNFFVEKKIGVETRKENVILNIDFSIGAATYPKDALEYDTLLYIADQAMYKAKNEIKTNPDSDKNYMIVTYQDKK